MIYFSDLDESGAALRIIYALKYHQDKSRLEVIKMFDTAAIPRSKFYKSYNILLKGGFVEDVPDPEKPRVIYSKLTPAGLRLAEAVERLMIVIEKTRDERYSAGIIDEKPAFEREFEEDLFAKLDVRQPSKE